MLPLVAALILISTTSLLNLDELKESDIHACITVQGTCSLTFDLWVWAWWMLMIQPFTQLLTSSSQLPISPLKHDQTSNKKGSHLQIWANKSLIWFGCGSISYRAKGRAGWRHLLRNAYTLNSGHRQGQYFDGKPDGSQLNITAKSTWMHR